MRRLILSILKTGLISLLFLSTVQGIYGFECAAWSITGELLYLRPSIDQSYYVISSSNNFFGEDIYPSGKRSNVHPTYQSAYRLEGAFTQCIEKNFWDFMFTYFSGDQSDSVSGGFLFDTAGFPGNGAQAPEDTSYSGTARQKEHFKYYAADAIFHRFLLACCPEEMSFQFGAHFARILVEERFTSNGFSLDDETLIEVSNRLRRDSRFWGIGPEFGVHYQRGLCLASQANGNLYIEALGRAGLLVSNTKARFRYTTLRTGPSGVNLDNEHLWRIVPFADAKLGIGYNFNCRCAIVDVKLGYEFIWYHNSIDAIVGYDVAFAGDSIDVFSSLSLHGPYASIGIAF